jgi:hypothetical protein
MPVLLLPPQYIRGTTRAKNIGLYRLIFERQTELKLKGG